MGNVVLTPERYRRMSRREFLEMMAMVAGGAALASCSPAATPTPVTKIVPSGMTDTSMYKKDPPWTIAFSSQGPTNSWIVMFEAHVDYGVNEKYKDLFKKYIYTDCNGSADKQVNDMQDILVQKPDVIVMGAMGAAALVGQIERAMDMGIPVVMVSSKANTDRYITFIEPNNYTFGQECAKYVVNKLNGQGNVICLSGIAGAQAAEDRLAGARAIWAQNPGIKEVGQAYCNWSPIEGKQATEAFIAANPQIDAVWSDSGVMAIGAIQAFEEAGRKVPPLTGEQFNAYLRALVTKGLEGFALVYPTSIGLTAVELAIATMRGEMVPFYVPVPMDLYWDETIKDLYAADMPDDYWPGHSLPDSWIDKLFTT